MTDTEGTDPSPIPLWTDDALDLLSEDRLDRERFVQMVADRIDACEPGQKSTVFGLVGSWGSGKTTLIKYILQRLSSDWKVTWFSPWASDTVSGLQFEFLAALASNLEGRDKKVKEAKEALDKYGSVCAPLLNAIPFVGTALAGFTKQGIEQATKGTPWHKQFDKASEKLTALGWRVLLVADDIDRLDAEELVAFLKVVRLLGRFPNVHYLIAYDQATVESLLESRHLGDRSSAFMEKIVQYPFEVPPIAPVIQRRLLIDAINKFLEAYKIGLNELQLERFSSFVGVLAPGFATPRAQKRFGEQLLSFGGMLNFGEIDVVDFVALSFLRVFYHDIYDRIPVWKGALQSGKDLVGFHSSEITDEEWTARIRELVAHDDDAVLVKRVLAGLFSGIKSDSLSAKDHDLALSDDTYFHRFFLFGIPENDVEDRLIRSAIIALFVGNYTDPDVTRYQEILDGDDNQLAALAYEKSQRFRSDKLKEPNVNLVSFLFDRLKALGDDIPSFDSAGSVLWRWVPSETLKCLISGELTAADIFARGLTETTVLRLAGRMLASGRIADDTKLKALEGFSAIYHDRLVNDIGGVLDSDLDFNSVVSLVSRVSGEQYLRDFGDVLMSSGDSALLDRVVRAMVTVNRWPGGENELVFNSETLTRLFRLEAIRQLVELLPAPVGLALIKNYDLSPENQADFARASVKSVSEMIS